ncbi:MAG: cyclase family protein [Promethearchaeota archaeon]
MHEKTDKNEKYKEPFIRVYDISPALGEKLPVWPGDARVSANFLHRFENGDRNRLSELHMGTHSGSHLDAPAHFLPEGKFIDELPLDRFMGACEVVGVDSEVEISVEDVRTGLGRDPKAGEKILFKTRNSEAWARGPTFFEEFVALSHGAARYLAEKGVGLVGVDYLSVEKYKSPVPVVHRTLAEAGVVNLEGLDLSRVKPGSYFLVALPLKLVGLEGSPVRAILFR